MVSVIVYIVPNQNFDLSDNAVQCLIDQKFVMSFYWGHPEGEPEAGS